MEKRLYKSPTNKVLAGVCGGIGEYFDIDPVLVRVVWVISAFFGGAGLLAYIIAAIVIPSKEELYRGRVYESTYRPASSKATSSESKKTGENDGDAEASAFEGAQETGETAGSDAAGEESYDVNYRHKSGDTSSRTLGGIILIVLGGVFLFKELLPWVDGGLIVAACFIAMGAYFLIRKNGETK